MSAIRTSLQRRKTGLGLSCLVMSLLLWSPGVRTVRAEENSEQQPSEVVVVPAVRDGQIEMSPRAPDARAEAVNGVVVLNTRGYNYGPNRPTARPQVEQVPTAPPAQAK